MMYHALQAKPEYGHKTISRKFDYVYPMTGLHNRNVETFNDIIKSDIKMQCGVCRVKRKDFLALFFIHRYSCRKFIVRTIRNGTYPIN